MVDMKSSSRREFIAGAAAALTAGSAAGAAQTPGQYCIDCQSHLFVPEVVAIKEASGDLGQMAEILRLAGDKITLLSGDDNLTLPVLAIGGAGVVSVVANIVPKATAAVIEAWEKGQPERAKQLYYQLLPLCQAMFYETNPIPVKTSLALMGKVDVEMRLPLCPMASANLERLKKALKDYGLIH